MAGFDYVIVGGGSAGCTLAARLSEDPAVSVCLLEAGGANKELLVRMPAGVGSLIKAKGKHNWGFWTQPEPHLDNRRLWWPRGRGLGGSSSINGMVYTRGHPQDFDEWRQLGLTGWSWEDVLPYFRKLEGHHRIHELHGADGPLKISGGESDSPFHDALIEAGRQAGYPVTENFNGAEQEGFGRYDLTISDGQRWSTAAAYLRPVATRKNLTVITDARTAGVSISGGRAVAVSYIKDNEIQRVEVDGEVILCAGAVQSPHILQLSGIGNGASLREAGVRPVHDLPGVGENLQDHLDIIMSWYSRGLKTAFSSTKGLRQLRVGLEYLTRGTGLGRQQFLESGAFICSREGLSRPDVQIHGVLAIMKDHGKTRVKADGFSLHLCQLRPESRGRIALGSTDPTADPLIYANYLASEVDRRVMRDCVHIGREVAYQAALDPYRGDEYAPGRTVQSDAEIDTWVRANAETIYHPVGTCKMGADGDKMAVVDEQLRVRGLTGLRVVDASVMPTLVGSNTNAPTIMIAEKAADLIRGVGKPAALAA
ncbi:MULTISPECIES: choline dehydrogenase [unclassified Sphingomonas]|uniref:choline dehydrogenase n=1 Tax=unclassified Sphingomonas TaxID=196159 RepID=UPI001D121D15|nr:MULTISPECIES: choline dehydrogenase [unclassified Sphingomonas]MCC2979322.1 choline dehydrogenase [Sphingomonas sp. IC4-52]MCD2315445.1 choline dehydrogenase [Sphingomonas sp. IC-11]